MPNTSVMTAGLGLAFLALAAAGAGAASARPVTVVAQTDPEVLTARISYGDINLATAAGAALLEQRVGGAVRSVCAPLEQTRQEIALSSCHRTAWTGARPQMERALQRARELASRGSSPIPLAAIEVVAG